jgi:hypothetical protein
MSFFSRFQMAPAGIRAAHAFGGALRLVTLNQSIGEEYTRISITAVFAHISQDGESVRDLGFSQRNMALPTAGASMQRGRFPGKSVFRFFTEPIA